MECGVLREQGVRPGGVVRGSRHWLYPALGVLRLLLLKRTDPAAWKRVEGLMDHWQEWQQDLQVHMGVLYCRLYHLQVVEATQKLGQFLQQGLKLDCSQEEVGPSCRYTGELCPPKVSHCWGVLKTNSVSLGDREGRVLYPLVSLLSHSCNPCLEPVITPRTKGTFTLRCRATVQTIVTVDDHLLQGQESNCEG